MYVRDESHIEEAVGQFRLALESMLPHSKKGAVWDVKKKVDGYTNPQRRFYFKNCDTVAKCLNDAGMSDEGFGIEIAYTSERIHKLTERKLGKATITKDTTKEFSDYMEKMFEMWITITKGEWLPLESTASYFEKNGYNINDKGEIEI